MPVGGLWAARLPRTAGSDGSGVFRRNLAWASSSPLGTHPHPVLMEVLEEEHVGGGALCSPLVTLTQTDTLAFHLPSGALPRSREVFYFKL